VQLGIPTFFTPLEWLLIVLLVAILLFYVYKKTRSSQTKYVADSDGLPTVKKSFESYKDAILLLSDKGEILFANRACAILLGLPQGFDQESLREAEVLRISSESQMDIYTFIEHYRPHLNGTEELSVRAKIMRDGNELPIKIFLGRMNVPSPCMVVAISDISAEKEIIAFRQQDQVTHLPNQSKAVSDLGMIISKMQAEDTPFALILISLDNFTEIRAMLGYQQTDSLIGRIARELQHIAKGLESELYHMMRNNFLIVTPKIDTGVKAKEMVENIKNRLELSFEYSNSSLPLTFSTGVSFFPQGGSSVDELIDSAYKALSEAKEQGNGYIVADEEGLYAKEKQYEIGLYDAMRSALKNREFELFYQPLVAIESEEIVGAEALVRWNRPGKGIVSPDSFIPIAEKTGFIVDIDKFVIEEAIKQQKKWEIFKFKSIQVSINLSLRDVESGEIADFVAKHLLEHKVAPEMIKFEITENSAMVNSEITKKEFLALKKLGVHLALDDFGTGYSSFSHIKDFSLDTLKIDRSFVTDMLSNSEHQKLVRAMIELGHNFDLQVTAEGIEDRETLEMLQSLGCDIAQGYYFSKPLPVFEFQESIRRKLGETKKQER